MTLQPDTHTVLTEAAQKCLQNGDLAVAQKLITLLQEGAPSHQSTLVLPADAPRTRGQRVDFAAVRESRYEDVKKHILTSGKAIATHLQKQFDLNPYQVKRMLADMAQEGLVSKEGTPRTGKRVLKRLTVDGMIVDADTFDAVGQKSAEEGGEAVEKAAKKSVKRARKAKKAKKAQA